MANVFDEESFLKLLRTGERVQCPLCKKGTWGSEYESPEKSHLFCCSFCGDFIHIDYNIDID